MDKGHTMVIGMSIAYGASFLGMILAWYFYHNRHRDGGKK